MKILQKLICKYALFRGEFIIGYDAVGHHFGLLRRKGVRAFRYRYGAVYRLVRLYAARKRVGVQGMSYVYQIAYLHEYVPVSALHEFYGIAVAHALYHKGIIGYQQVIMTAAHYCSLSAPK